MQDIEVSISRTVVENEGSGAAEATEVGKPAKSGCALM
jgi:hypothetical protein